MPALPPHADPGGLTPEHATTSQPHSLPDVAETQGPLTTEPPALAMNENSLHGASPEGSHDELRKSQLMFESMGVCTPFKDDSHISTGKIANQKIILSAELGPIPEVKNTWLHTIYRSEVLDKSIDDFLRDSPLYDSVKKRWDVPETVVKEEEMYKPLMKIIKAILEGPGKAPPGCSDIREAVDTHDAWLTHSETGTKTRPDIAIAAAGPSFEEPTSWSSKTETWADAKIKRVGFSNIASVFDVKRNKGRDKEMEQVEQGAIYNRQIFIHQPNRLYARSLILTENRYQGLHYCRSGAFYTEYLDLHLYPATFVRLVCGLSSYDERDVGLDTNIQWKIEDGRKTSGTISTVDANGEKAVYSIEMNKPSFIRHAIRGQGTMYWDAKGSDGARVLIKDSWQADGRTRESVILDQAANVDGAVKVIALEDNLAHTRDFRPANFEFEDFVNRTLARVTLACPGPSLAHFSSRVEAFAAIRDSIKGHRDLLIKQILHRNITMETILIVKGEGSSRGVVFDLDMALCITIRGGRPPLALTHRTGSTIYMPISMLRSYKEKLFRIKLAQDYLDDLESYYYVLSKLMMGFEGVGKPVPAGDDECSVLGGWEGPPHYLIARNKYSYLRGLIIEPFPEFWTPPCTKLNEKFQKYMFDLAAEKDLISQMKDPKERGRRLHNLYNKIDSHYETIIAYFDEAVEALEKAGEILPPQASPAPTVTFSPLPSLATSLNPFSQAHGLATGSVPHLTLYGNGQFQFPAVPFNTSTPPPGSRLRNTKLARLPPSPSMRPGKVYEAVPPFFGKRLVAGQKRTSEDVEDVEDNTSKRNRRSGAGIGGGSLPTLDEE